MSHHRQRELKSWSSPVWFVTFVLKCLTIAALWFGELFCYWKSIFQFLTQKTDWTWDPRGLPSCFRSNVPKAHLLSGSVLLVQENQQGTTSEEWDSQLENPTEGSGHRNTSIADFTHGTPSEVCAELSVSQLCDLAPDHCHKRDNQRIHRVYSLKKLFRKQNNLLQFKPTEMHFWKQIIIPSYNKLALG